MSQRLITGLTFAISIIAAILYMPHSAFIVTLLLIISVGFWEWTQFLSWPKIPSMIAFLAITILFFLGLRPF